MTDALTKTLLTFRDTMRSVCPPWLQRGLAEKIMYSLAVQLDAFGDALVAGVKQRFPGLYSFDSLSIIGRERRIPRGRAEADADYGERLRHFLTDHAVRGGPYAMLRQLHWYWLPALFDIELIYWNGRRFTRDVALYTAALAAPDATPTKALEQSIVRDIVPGGWHPDTDPVHWARWWLFYYTDQWAYTPPTDEELAELKLIPRQWNAAHPLGTIVLFPSDGELWGWPLGHVWGEPGTWGVTGGTVRFIDVGA